MILSPHIIMHNHLTGQLNSSDLYSFLINIMLVSYWKIASKMLKILISVQDLITNSQEIFVTELMCPNGVPLVIKRTEHLTQSFDL